MAGAKSYPGRVTRRRTCKRRAPLKKLRCLVRREVARQAERGRSVRLMFQDEGRFGLLGKPRRCWAPIGVRPVVGARLVLSPIHISEPTRRTPISYAVFCLKKK